MVDLEKVVSFSDWQAERKKREKERIKRKLLKQQEEAARYKHLEMALEEVKIEGLVDQTEYLEWKEVYDKKLQAVQESRLKLKEEWKKQVRDTAEEQIGGIIAPLTGNIWDSAGKNKIEGQEWEQLWKNQNLTELTRYMVVTLIERIVVYENCRIEIQFRYRDYNKFLC